MIIKYKNKNYRVKDYVIFTEKDIKTMLNSILNRKINIVDMRSFDYLVFKDSIIKNMCNIDKNNPLLNLYVCNIKKGSDILKEIYIKLLITKQFKNII